MTRLIHVNGPPAIGKSTLAALWAERHPGTLNVDIDSLHRLVGGWRDPANHTHELLRPVALAMTTTHLSGGHDVIVPQYLGHEVEVAAFARVAHEQGAQFHEVVLLDDRAASIARFDRRGGNSEWDEHNRRVVAAQGGLAFLSSMYDQLLELLTRRPSAIVVRSELDAIEATYTALAEALKGAKVEGADCPTDTEHSS